MILPSPITPPNLLGIARKIEYANKKYHSGLICVGVFIGFAILKLSGSPRWYGNWKLNKYKNVIIKSLLINKPTYIYSLRYFGHRYTLLPFHSR